MALSWMTFSTIRDQLSHRMTADILCKTAQSCGLSSIDVMEYEVKFMGKEKLLAAMDTYGIRIGCLITNAPFFEKPRDVMPSIEKSLDLAEELGTSFLMVIPGSGRGKDITAVEALGDKKTLQYTVKHFRNIVEAADKRGITVGFENTPHDFKPLASARACKAILDRVPGLGLIFDTGNFRVADKNCDEMAAYELLKDRIVRVHVKDVVIGDFKGEACVGGQAIRAVMTGAGVIPLRKLLPAMIRDGYEGDFCIEYASPMTVHGEDEGPVLQLYVDTINGMLSENENLCPTTAMDGIDKPVSRLFFGTAIMPMLMGKDASVLLDAAFSAGVTAFDTARGYGKAENSLGKWIAARNNRDRIVILSKCGNVSMGGKVAVNRAVIEKELEKSLKALGTDYIDIYLLHRDDPKTPVSEFIDVLNEKQREGKIRIFGVSNWTHERIAEANAYAKETGQNGFTVSSPNFGLAEQVGDPWGGEVVTIAGPTNEAARAWYTENQIPVIAYSSLGRGFFSGKFKSFDYDGAKKVLDGPAQKGYLCEANMRRLSVAEEIAERDGCSVTDVALRYIFSTPMNVFAIASSTNPTRIRSNIAALKNTLTAEDMEKLL